MIALKRGAGWGDSSVGKVLATQVQGSSLISRTHVEAMEQTRQGDTCL